MIADWLRGRWVRLRSWLQPKPKPYAIVYVEADELPELFPSTTLVVAREGSTQWISGMHCPCNCGRQLSLMLLPGVKPRWDFREEPDGTPSLRPSVWVADGCRSHFWLKNGHIIWCRD